MMEEIKMLFDSVAQHDAFLEGWGLFETDEDDGLHIDIARLDSPRDAHASLPLEPMFDSDAAAVAHVKLRAAEGSALHQAALRLHGTVTPWIQWCRVVTQGE